MTRSVEEGEATSASPAASSNVVQRIVRWLRAGYPDGVPQQDYVALLGILRRTLTPTELARVVDELVADAASGEEVLTEQLVQDRITDVVKGAVDQRDVDRVSGRLASVGWPLGFPVRDDSVVGLTTDGPRTGLVNRVVDWLRTGYPSGLPEQDYVPLVALLRRRLTDEEVSEVGRLLADNGSEPTDRVDIGSAIARVTSELPSEADVKRVQTYLAGHEGPLDFDV
jgi:Protein of unknown function (DUF3349)